MSRSYRYALAMIILLCALGVPARGPVATATTVPPRDVLSGTWQVSRTCLTICSSPSPVRKIVHHRQGNVYVTEGTAPQVLLQLDKQVLVHGPKDSLLLTTDQPGRLMTGSGIGADGSTFTTTWRCVTRDTTVITASATFASVAATKPAQQPLTMGVC